VSAGHGHRRPNAKHPAELRKLMDEPDFRRCWNRPFRVDDTKHVFDTAGYNVRGNIYYRDADFVRAVRDGEWRNPLTGGVHTMRVPGMSAEQILDAILRHERIEKCLLDADNNIKLYPDAHEFATVGEHDAVPDPKVYEAILRPIIHYNENKTLTSVPRDLSCAPMLDDPDFLDRRGLAQMRAAGNPDAAKVSKETEHYRMGAGQKRCENCIHYLVQPPPWNPQCEVVDGTLLHEWVCNSFQAATKERINEAQQGPSGVQGRGEENRPQPQNPQPRGSSGGGGAERQSGGQARQSPPQTRERITNGQASRSGAQQAPDEQFRIARRAQVPNAGQEPRGERQSKGEPASEEGQSKPGIESEDRRQGQSRARPLIASRNGNASAESDEEMERRVIESLERLSKSLETKQQQPMTLKIEHGQPPIGRDDRALVSTLLTESRKTQLKLDKVSEDNAKLAKSLAGLGEAITKLAEREVKPPPITVKLQAPKRRKRKIVTKRDEHGNLVAEVSEEGEE